jgi:NAD(P)H-dependent flavin oxidoreductase YrpB (nitropropane dioxygenase family)
MITTRLTEQYGIRHPLVRAGMGFIALRKLVAAVSNSCALGLLGVAPAPLPVFQAFVQQVKALTPHLFGVSLVMETTAFGPSTVEEHIEVCIEEQIRLVTFSGIFHLNAGWRNYGLPVRIPGCRLARSSRHVKQLSADSTPLLRREAKRKDITVLKRDWSL